MSEIFETEVSYVNSVSNMPTKKLYNCGIWKENCRKTGAPAGGYNLEYGYPVSFVGYSQDGAFPILLGDRIPPSAPGLPSYVSRLLCPHLSVPHFQVKGRLYSNRMVGGND